MFQDTNIWFSSYGTVIILIFVAKICGCGFDDSLYMRASKWGALGVIKIRNFHIYAIITWKWYETGTQLL